MSIACHSLRSEHLMTSSKRRHPARVEVPVKAYIGLFTAPNAQAWFHASKRQNQELDTVE
eukprot:6210151-Pleurochrysis_carterae.AAC.1